MYPLSYSTSSGVDVPIASILSSSVAISWTSVSKPVEMSAVGTEGAVTLKGWSIVTERLWDELVTTGNSTICSEGAVPITMSSGREADASLEPVKKGNVSV